MIQFALGLVAGLVVGGMGRIIWVRDHRGWIRISDGCVGLSREQVDSLTEGVRDELMKLNKRSLA